MKKNVVAIALQLITLASIFLSSCSEPFSDVNNKTWEGQVYRRSDNKQLSDTRLKFSNDTLFLYANAIFGAANDTLIRSFVNKEDSTFVYNSINGTAYQFKLTHNSVTNLENLFLLGDDYYITLGVSPIKIGDLSALDFYKNYDVPRNSLMYLDGTYKGELEMDNQVMELFMADIGGISFQVDFLDDFKLKMKVKSLAMDMFGGGAPKPEIHSYKVRGKKLIIGKNGKDGILQVRNDGRTLVYEMNGKSVVMHKVY